LLMGWLSVPRSVPSLHKTHQHIKIHPPSSWLVVVVVVVVAVLLLW
jgi:hypothetical protein